MSFQCIWMLIRKFLMRKRLNLKHWVTRKFIHFEYLLICCTIFYKWWQRRNGGRMTEEMLIHDAQTNLLFGGNEEPRSTRCHFDMPFFDGAGVLRGVFGILKGNKLEKAKPKSFVFFLFRKKRSITKKWG